MSTNLLKRAEPLLSSKLVSIILLLNAQLLDANASGTFLPTFNPRGVRNEDSLPVPELNFIRGTTPESKHLDAAYFKLWNLLGSMHDPRILLRTSPPVGDDSTPKIRESIKSMLSAMEEVTLEFSRVAKEAKEHMRNPAKEKLLEPVSRNFFCPKYLTSRELFDAQIKDSLFRRQVLVHFLLKCEVLLFYSEYRVKHYEAIIARLGKKGRRNKFILPERADKVMKDEIRAWVTTDEEKEIKSIRSRIIIVLSRIPPHGSEFVEAIIQLLREEASWMWWKTRFLQPLFDLPPLDVPELMDYVPPPAPMPTDSTGIKRLDSMWDSLSVPLKERLPEIDLNDWVKDLDDEISGYIDREYQKSRKEQWKWQTYRLYVRHHFSTMTAPTTTHPLRDVKRRALGEPDLTEAEIEEMREREREAEEMRLALKEERRLAAEREEQKRQRREAEESERRRKVEEGREKQRAASAELKRQHEEEQQRDEGGERDQKRVKESRLKQQPSPQRIASDLPTGRKIESERQRQSVSGLGKIELERSSRELSDHQSNDSGPHILTAGNQSRSTRDIPRDLKDPDLSSTPPNKVTSMVESSFPASPNLSVKSKGPEETTNTVRESASRPVTQVSGTGSESMSDARSLIQRSRHPSAESDASQTHNSQKSDNLGQTNTSDSTSDWRGRRGRRDRDRDRDSRREGWERDRSGQDSPPHTESIPRQSSSLDQRLGSMSGSGSNRGGTGSSRDRDAGRESSTSSLTQSTLSRSRGLAARLAIPSPQSGNSDARSSGGRDDDRNSLSRDSTDMRSRSPVRDSISPAQVDSDRSRMRGRGSTRALSNSDGPSTIGAGSNLFRRLAEGRSTSDLVSSSGAGYDDRRPSSSSQGSRYDRDLDESNRNNSSARKRSRGGFDEYRPETMDHRHKRHRG